MAAKSAKKRAAKPAETSTRKTAASPAAAETSATPATSRRAAAKSAAAAAATPASRGNPRGTTTSRVPGRREIDPASIPATRTEVEAVRAGKAKPDNKKPLPRPRVLSPRATILNPDETPANAEVVDLISDERRRPKGYREETVVATRMGYYGNKRRRHGEVFTMAFVGDGYLPSWVKVANEEDQDPEVSRSRQVIANSTGQEIRDDARRDAGTEVPTSLGGNQRRPTDSSGDVL